MLHRKPIIAAPAALLLVLACFAQPAAACWEDVPIEKILEGADLVVVGKITDIPSVIVRNKRDYSLATLTVRETLKGKVDGNSVKLTFPDKATISTDIIYRKGQDGVWILNKDKTTGHYMATYPKDYQKLDELPKIRPILNLQAAPKYKLPEDANEVVLQYDVGGGMMRRVNDEPLLAIHADGTVKLGSPYGWRKAMQTKISADRVQEILATVLHVHDFENVDADEIKKEIEKEGRHCRIADAGTVFVRVDVKGHKHSANIYALDDQARLNKHIKPLQDMAAIENYLTGLIHVAYAGGEKKLAQRLAEINRALRKKYSKAPPLTAGDLRYATATAKGELKITFRRVRKLDLAEQITTATATYPLEDSGKKPEIKVGFYARDVSKDNSGDGLLPPVGD